MLYKYRFISENSENEHSFYDESNKLVQNFGKSEQVWIGIHYTLGVSVQVFLTHDHNQNMITTNWK